MDIQAESTRKVVTVALVLSVPGPLLVLLSCLIPVPWISANLFINGFYCGLCCNFVGLWLGLFRWFHPLGLIAFCVSMIWWLWIFWVIAYSDWNL